MNKLKDNIAVIIGIVMMILFMVFMFVYNNETKKVKLIREDLYNDSIINLEHDDIKLKDSQLILINTNLQNSVDNHEVRLRRLERWKNNVDTNQ
jgi:hypothetical protein